MEVLVKILNLEKSETGTAVDETGTVGEDLPGVPSNSIETMSIEARDPVQMAIQRHMGRVQIMKIN